MPARQEKRLNSNIKKLAIIAGAGALPQKLFQVCQSQNIETLLIGFHNYTDQVTPDYWTRIGASGGTVNYLKSQNVTDIVMIGAIKRPSFKDLWPDWQTLKFFIKAWLNSYGDDGILKAARRELEQRGFKLHGIHEFLPELLMPEGILTKKMPSEAQKKDITLGIEAARHHGVADLGQAVLIKNGEVIAKEHQNGTDAMIRHHGEEGAILIKMCKPQQDRDLDLPTIGPKTVKACITHKMAGIVGQAGEMLAVDIDEMIKLADQHNIFIEGINIGDQDA
jgi:hypothetical protein